VLFRSLFCCGCSSSILGSHSARDCTNTESSCLGGSVLGLNPAGTGTPTPFAGMTPAGGSGRSSQQGPSHCLHWQMCSQRGELLGQFGAGGLPVDLPPWQTEHSLSPISFRRWSD